MSENILTPVEVTATPVAVAVTPVEVAVTPVEVAPVAVHMENLKAKKESVISEKIPHAVGTLDHTPIIDALKDNPHFASTFDLQGPAVHGVKTGKFAEFSDNNIKKIGSKTGHSMYVVLVPLARDAEFKIIAKECNDSYVNEIVKTLAEASIGKNTKKVEAANKKANKEIEKEAKAAQKIIDDAAKVAKKAEVKLAKEQEAPATIDAGTLDVSGLFTSADIQAPITEADPILAAALSAAQVNANIQAFADAPITMAAE